MSQIVINDILPRTQLTATLNQTEFNAPWTANTASDVYVYVTPFGDAPDDAEQILAYPVDYSVDFIGSQREVRVTLTAPSASGDIVTIIRQTPADRQNLYSNTNFTPTMLNNDFGILTLVDQQAQMVDQIVGPRYNYSANLNTNNPVSTRDSILPTLQANEGWVMNPDHTAIIPYTFPTNGIAPADGSYVTVTDETATLPNSISLLDAGNGILVNDTVNGVLIGREITGTTQQIDIINGTGLSGNINVSISDNPIINGTAGIGLPEGTTSQRVIPSSGQSLRYNTDLSTFEYYDGAWYQIGNSGDLSNYLPLAGGTMLGFLILNADPVVALGAATKQYIDNLLTVSPGYLPLSGGTMTGSLFLASDPTFGSEAATKQYVDNAVQNITIAANFGTTTDLASWVYSNGALGVGATLIAPINGSTNFDGNVPINGNRILVKNQVTQFQNGIYTIVQGTGGTPTVLTRATDYDQSAEMQAGDIIAIVGGTTLATTSWMMTQTAAITVGTTAITWQQQAAPSGALLAVNNLNDVNNPTLSFNNISPLTTKGDLIGHNGVNNVRFPIAVGDGKILQVNVGGAVGLAYSTSTYPSTATSAGTILRADGTNWLPTTATYPNTTTMNQLLYSSVANVVSGLATANSSVLVTSAGGIPSFSTSLPAGLTIPGYALSGANADITSMTALTGKLQAPTAIASSLGENVLGFTYNASAVNYITIINNNTGAGPGISSSGTDTNIDMLLLSKGTGNIGFYNNVGSATPLFVLRAVASSVNWLELSPSTTTNPITFTATGSDSNIGIRLNSLGTKGIELKGYSDASNGTTGYVGEYLTSNITSGTPVVFTSGVIKNLTSITLTAGDWNIYGTFLAFGTTITNINACVSALDGVFVDSALQMNISPVATSTICGSPVPMSRQSISTTSTFYLVAKVTGTGTLNGVGYIRARRMR